MQRLTFNMIGSRPPVSVLNPELVRERMSMIGLIDPSIIIKTDDTVAVSIDRNIYNISTNLELKTVKLLVSAESTITLPSENHGIQELLVNMETMNESPAFGELDTDEYSISGNMITLNTNLYANKLTYVKYLTVK